MNEDEEIYLTAAKAMGWGPQMAVSPALRKCVNTVREPLLAELDAMRARAERAEAQVERVREQARAWIASYWPEPLRVGRIIMELLGEGET